MPALRTFIATISVGAVLATIAQLLACPAWAAFMGGLGYLLIVSLVLNSRSGAER